MLPPNIACVRSHEQGQLLLSGIFYLLKSSQQCKVLLSSLETQIGFLFFLFFQLQASTWVAIGHLSEGVESERIMYVLPANLLPAYVPIVSHTEQTFKRFSSTQFTQELLGSFYVSYAKLGVGDKAAWFRTSWLSSKNRHLSSNTSMTYYRKRHIKCYERIWKGNQPTPKC